MARTLPLVTAVIRPPTPRPPDFEILVARARAAGPIVRPPIAAASLESSTIRRWARAAAVFLAIAGSASAATIAVNQWVVNRAAPLNEPLPQVSTPAPEPQAPTRSGVTVLPQGGRIVVAVRGVAAGTRIEVGQVVDTWLGSNKSVAETVEYFELPERFIAAALQYYAAFQEEIDEWRQRKQELADREYEAWKREQALLA